MHQLLTTRPTPELVTSVAGVLHDVSRMLCEVGGQRQTHPHAARGAAGSDSPPRRQPATLADRIGAETGCPLSEAELAIYNRVGLEPFSWEE